MGGIGSTSKRINNVNRKGAANKEEEQPGFPSNAKKSRETPNSRKTHGVRDSNDYQNWVPLNTERLMPAMDQANESKSGDESVQPGENPSVQPAKKEENQFMKLRFQGGKQMGPGASLKLTEKNKIEGSFFKVSKGNKFRVTKKVRKDWTTKLKEIQASLQINPRSFLENSQVRKSERELSIDLNGSRLRISGDNRVKLGRDSGNEEESIQIHLPGGLNKKKLAQEAPVLRRKLEEYIHEEEASKRSTKSGKKNIQNKDIIYEKRIGNTKVQVSTDLKRENPMKSQPVLSQLVTFNLNTIDYLTRKQETEKKITKLVDSYDPSLSTNQPNYGSFVRFPVNSAPKKEKKSTLSQVIPEQKKEGQNKLSYSEALFENDVMLKLELHQEMLRLAEGAKAKNDSSSFSSDSESVRSGKTKGKVSSNHESIREIKKPLLVKTRSISKQLSMNLDYIGSPLLKMKRPTMMNGSPLRIGTRSIFSNGLNSSDFMGYNKKPTIINLSNFGQNAHINSNIQ